MFDRQHWWKWVACIVALLTICALVYFLSPSEWQPLLFKIGAITVAVICVVVIIVDFIFLLPTVGGAIYLPSSDEQIAAMLKLAHIKRGEKAVDIGSGDGRIVSALAKAGADAYGIEINPILVRWSQWKMSLKPRSERGHIQLASFWYVNFAEYSVVTIFGMNYIMKDLEKKLITELKPGARVICNSFPFPNWPVHRKIGSVYEYSKSR